MTTTTALAVRARDGWFLKDGREWAPTVARSLDWPMPSTLLGALRTAVGRSREVMRGNALADTDWLDIRGRTALDAMIALRRPIAPAGTTWASAHRVWPVPSDAVFLTDDAGAVPEVRLLRPQPASLCSIGRDDEPSREALWWPHLDSTAKPGRAPSWWHEDALVEWLSDDRAAREWSGPYRGHTMPRHIRMHMEMDSQRKIGREGILFGHDVVETLDGAYAEWAIGCAFRHPDEPPTGFATLGGDRRTVMIEPAAGDIFTIPEALERAFRERGPRGVRLMTVTPAAFQEGWLPDGFRREGSVIRGRLPNLDHDVILRAAFVQRAVHVSGWDMVRHRPKPTVRLVPPGSMFHLVKASGESFTAEDARSLWLMAMGSLTSEGFGRFVPGIWSLEEARC